MDTKPEKSEKIKGRLRFLIECLIAKLRYQEHLHIIDAGNKRRPDLEINVERALQNLGRLLTDAVFYDEVGLLKSNAGPNVTRSLLQAAISGLTFPSLEILMELVKKDPADAARLITDTRIGLEFIDKMATFDDDESGV